MKVNQSSIDIRVRIISEFWIKIIVLRYMIERRWSVPPMRWRSLTKLAISVLRNIMKIEKRMIFFRMKIILISEFYFRSKMLKPNAVSNPYELVLLFPKTVKLRNKPVNRKRYVMRILLLDYGEVILNKLNTKNSTLIHLKSFRRYRVYSGSSKMIWMTIFGWFYDKSQRC